MNSQEFLMSRRKMKRAVYVGSLAVVVLLVGAVYEFLLRFVG